MTPCKRLFIVLFACRSPFACSGLEDGSVVVADSTKHADRLVLTDGHRSPIRDVAFSSDGGLLASIDEEGLLMIRQFPVGEMSCSVLRLAG